jgi:hypothetical protein
MCLENISVVISSWWKNGVWWISIRMRWYMVKNGWGSEGETGDWSGHPVSVSHPFECEMAYGDTWQGM